LLHNQTSYNVDERSWIDHDVIKRIVEVNATVECVDPIRIGVGRSPPLTSAADLLTLKVKIGDEYFPCIPGSSWKGVFRSTCEKIAKVYAVKDVCSGLTKQTCFDNIKKTLFDMIKSNLPREQIRDLVWNNTCVLCKIFGGPSYSSNILFGDSYPLIINGKPCFKIGYRIGIAIDRKTGSVKRGALYNVEYIEPGSKFNFSIRAYNLPNYALGLVFYALNELHEGRVRVGGFKSRGFGRIVFRDLKIRKCFSSGPSSKFEAIDEHDKEVVVDGDPWLNEDYAWSLVKKLMEVWCEVASKLPYPKT